MEPASLVSLLAVLLIVAALIGMADIGCHDSNCRSVHKQHKQREREAKALALHRAQHNAWSAPGCRHCQERKDAGIK